MVDLLKTKNTSRIPSPIIILGLALEIKLWLKGEEYLIKMKRGKDAFFICTNNDQSKLFVLPKSIFKPTTYEHANKTFSDARAIYTNFTTFKSSKYFSAKIKTPQFKKYGRVLHIVYESDKWTKKKTDYIHTFEKPPLLHATTNIITHNAKKTIFAITGGNIAVTNKGIEG